MSLVEKLKPKEENFICPKELFQVREESQVIVKGYINDYRSSVRIFPDTYLKCNQTGKRFKLINSFNIGDYPSYTELRRHEYFTLIFEGLEKNCKSFDLIENLSEPRVFRKFKISRKSSDVYVLWF